MGGNLMDWIIHQREVEYPSLQEYEEKWALISKHVLKGLQYIHDSHEMIHRDIKPANILFLRKNDLNSVRICDFGLANKVGIGLFDQNYENVGTIMYQAPEQMDEWHSYAKAADLWAVGMIMYEMISKGGHPVLGKDIHKNVKMTISDYRKRMEKYDMNFTLIPHGNEISHFAKNLIQNLWNRKANLRYNWSRALRHPWITRNENDKIPLNIHEALELNLLRMVIPQHKPYRILIFQVLVRELT